VLLTAACGSPMFATAAFTDSVYETAAFSYPVFKKAVYVNSHRRCLRVHAVLIPAATARRDGSVC